ncbi:DUF4230 domain-containing protein [Ornithinibacillus scapharcae]|uniref:DUF4230 domain-containing protein n=1 Tax=Ornithinibacillus scapharcae TaxID=1147159 RepID=UPI000225BCEC|nr:DUF4230 domain-containing protein [Ornithinibacillus scapharcae]
MNKQDNQKQLDYIIQELTKGQEESAATATMNAKTSKRNLSGAVFKIFFRFWGVKLIAALLVIVLLVSGGIWYLTSGSTLKKESTTFVEQVQELATLATAEAHLKVVMEQSDNKIFGNDISINIPGTKREIVLIVPAKVIAGVNLKEITQEDIKVDEKNKRIDLTLPHATLIQEPSIQMDAVRTFSDEGLFRGDVEWVEGFDLAAEAQKMAQEEAIEVGLFESAEQNADKVMNEFFSNLGYTVNVTFK